MENLIRLLEKGVSQFHVAQECCNILRENGFVELKCNEDWNSITPGKYFVRPFASVVFIFASGKNPENIRLAAAHTDFPGLKLKFNPHMEKSGYTMVNVETYGGLLTDTWYDRPLGLSGKVMVKGKDIFHPIEKLIDSQEACCIIPSLAPHMKRDDKQTKPDLQKVLMPISGMEEDQTDLMKLISDRLGVSKEDILDHDLYLYNMDKPLFMHGSKNIISSPRIDNISSVAAIISAFVSENPGNNVLSAAALFDNEEIGSRSKQGADSVLFSYILEKYAAAAGITRERLWELLSEGFMMSLDVAHGTHPNYPEKNDPVNTIVLGQGVVLKTSAGQRYVTDSAAGAVILGAAKKYGIKVVRQVNRTGMPGGQTLGPIMSSYLPVAAVDMGIPVLAMHSAREMAHAEDYRELVKCLKVIIGEQN